MAKEKLIFNKDGVDIEVLIDTELKTLYLSQKELSKLYGKSTGRISTCISKMKKNTEIISSNFRVISVPNTPKPVTIYSLEIIKELDSIWNQNNYELLKEFLNKYLIENDEIIGYLDSADNRVITYENNGIEIDVVVSPEEDTVWLNQNQISVLFNTSQQLVAYHIKNILDEHELDGTSYKNSLYDLKDGRTIQVTLYNLEMIFSIGYRIKSEVAIMFRRWATSVLKQYIKRGYVYNENRISALEQKQVITDNVITILKNDIEELKNNSLLQDKLIYDGQVFDALVLIKQLIANKKRIILIDPYVDILTLNMLKEKDIDAEILVITSANAHLSKADVKKFKQQYGSIKLHKDDRKYHDRYLLLDKYYYHLGSSLNYLGKRLTEISIIDREEIKESLNLIVSKYLDQE